MPHKIGFKVVKFKSEEDGFRARELHAHAPTVKGWRSARFCTYPQEITVKLDDKIRLARIQVLLHQYLIPEKLELHVRESQDLDESTGDTSSFTQLGFIATSDNASTGYKARELKSVSVTCECSYLKLVLHKNHKNKLNNASQVGLIALNIIGEPVDSNTDDILPISLPPDYISPCDDLAFAMYVDPEVASIIRKMEHKKHEAVRAERFEYAKKLKAAMETLRPGGERLGKYEVEKRLAIELENYDRAQQKKAQQEQYRLQLYQTLLVYDLLEVDGICSQNDEPFDEARFREIPPPPRQALSPESPDALPPLAASPSSSASASSSGGGGSHLSSMHTRFEAYENRPLPPQRNTNGVNDPVYDYRRDTERSRILFDREKKPLDESLPLTVFGKALVDRFYSKKVPDKEDGLRQLEGLLRNYDRKEARHPSTRVTRAALVLLHRAVRDKVFSIFSMACHVLLYLFTNFIGKNRVTTTEIIHTVEHVLPELLLQSGDSAPRIRDTAIEAILSIAHSSPVREIHIVPVYLTRPFEGNVHPRVAQSRTEIVEQLMLTYGVSTEKGSGMTCSVLSKFGISALNQPTEAVRKVAERILVELYKCNPRLVRRQLPPDDDLARRYLQYRHLFEEYDKIDKERKAVLINSNINLRNSQPSKLKSPSASKTNKTVLSNASSINRQSSDITIDNDKTPFCIFCLERSTSFDEKGLDIHYWRYCPMLTHCVHCRQVIEISGLTDHLLEECEASRLYQQCPQCAEAVRKDMYEQHVKISVCQPKPDEGFGNHCPLCHQTIGPWEIGWRLHLAGDNPCPAHPRTPPDSLSEHAQRNRKSNSSGHRLQKMCSR